MEIASLLAHENFLMNAGLITAYSGEILWRYAVSQKGVAGAEIEIDQDEKNDGKNPKVSFIVTLEKKFKKRYALMCRLDKSPGWFSKWRKLRLMMKGIPLPGDLEKNIQTLATNYLPPRYKVHVKLAD